MSEVRWRVDGSYVYLDHPYREARTVHVLNNLLVDVLPNGRVVGVEKVGGAITTEDLATVLFLLPVEGEPIGRPPSASMNPPDFNG